MKRKTKKIKITNRGVATTSRGRFRTPIGPYNEETVYILRMITRDKLDVVEVLPDGREIPLTVQNFDKDNTERIPEVVKEVTPVKTEVITEKVDNNTGNAAQTNRQLSRKERKKMQHDQNPKVEVVNIPSKPEEKTEDTTIPEEALEQ